MTTRVAINGSGRIGRAVLRSAIERDAAQPLTLDSLDGRCAELEVRHRASGDAKRYMTPELASVVAHGPGTPRADPDVPLEDLVAVARAGAA